MNIYSLPAVIAFTINFSISLMVLLDNPGRSLNKWFSAFIFIFSAWNLSEIIILNSTQSENALLGAQILYRIIFLAPAIFFIIADIFPKGKKGKTFNMWHQILIIGLPIIVMAFSFPNFAIFLAPLSKSGNIYYYRIKITSDPSFIILLSLATVYILGGTILLIKKLGKAKIIRERDQIRFLLYGIIIIFIGYILINIFHEHHGRIVSFYFLSTLLTLFIGLFFFAAIMQFKIFRLSRLVSGSLAYTFLSSIVLAVYFLIIRGLSNSLSHLFHINSFLFNAGVILILVILIRPFESRIQHFIDRLLYRNIYHYRRNMLNFSQKLIKYHSMDSFFQAIIDFLKSNFYLKKVIVFFKEEESDSFKIWQPEKNNLFISADSYLPHYLSSKKSGSEFYEINHQKIQSDYLRFFIENQAVIFFPLLFESKMLGFIMLSEKVNKKTFTQEEIEILNIFFNESANTYSRNLMIDKVKEEEHERSRVEKMAAIGQMTAGIAHEIRNPLNTISTSAETLINKKLEEDTKHELLTYIVEESTRLNNLLTDFLKLSRNKSAHPQKTDIIRFFEKLTYDVDTKLSDNITFRINNNLLHDNIIIDQDLVYQLLLNLLKNGIDAISEKQALNPDFKGLLSLTISQTKSIYQFSVEDNGMGIAKEETEKVFDPFFTTKSVGTGLGLSVSANIAEILNGNIQLQTLKNVTRFIVTIPKNKKK